MQCVEYRDLVAAHVDEQLTRAEFTLANAHVAHCQSCAHLLETQRAFVPSFRAQNWTRLTPDATRRSILAQIEIEDARGETAGRTSWWVRPRLRLAFGIAVAVLVLAVTVPQWRARPHASTSPLFDALVTHYRGVQSKHVELTHRTDDPIDLRAYYLQSGVFPFRNTVPDLEALGFILAGGAISDLVGRPSTLSVYRGERGMIVCQRILAAGIDLPPGGEVVGGDRFYRVGDLTICVRRDGDALCFLVSSIPHAEFVKILPGHV